MISRLQQGDREAVATLYGWYGDVLYRQVILPRLPNRELAEDCLRDTFRAALEKIGGYRDQERSIFFWLRMIARNKAIDVYRARQRDHDLAERIRTEPTTALGQSTARPDRGLEMDDTRRMVALSMSRMNPRYATALRLRLLEERSREECARELGVTTGNFDVILHRACKAFRKVYPP